MCFDDDDYSPPFSLPFTRHRLYRLYLQPDGAGAAVGISLNGARVQKFPSLARSPLEPCVAPGGADAGPRPSPFSRPTSGEILIRWTVRAFILLCCGARR